jgi:hypothetical protein
MKPAAEDLERRRPIWEALSELFLDTELQERDYRWIAEQILGSGYCPSEVSIILWEEVFPAIECNVRHPAGVWDGFSADWLEELILRSEEKQTIAEQPRSAKIINETWCDVRRFLPDTAECEARCALLREIIGISHDKQRATQGNWLPEDRSTIVALARAIYEDRAFDHMPMLGDALEDAGCTDITILDRCRRANLLTNCWLVVSVQTKKGTSA